MDYFNDNTAMNLFAELDAAGMVDDTMLQYPLGMEGLDPNKLGAQAATPVSIRHHLQHLKVTTH